MPHLRHLMIQHKGKTMHSLTYSLLPQWLMEPLLQGAISQPEAAEIWDNYLLTPEGEFQTLPSHLNSAAERLHLWAMELSPTQH